MITLSLLSILVMLSCQSAPATPSFEDRISKKIKSYIDNQYELTTYTIRNVPINDWQSFDKELNLETMREISIIPERVACFQEMKVSIQKKNQIVQQFSHLASTSGIQFRLPKECSFKFRLLHEDLEQQLCKVVLLAATKE